MLQVFLGGGGMEGAFVATLLAIPFESMPLEKSNLSLLADC